MSPVHLKPKPHSAAAKLTEHVNMHRPKVMSAGFLIPVIAIIFLGYVVYFVAN